VHLAGDGECLNQNEGARPPWDRTGTQDMGLFGGKYKVRMGVGPLGDSLAPRSTAYGRLPNTERGGCVSKRCRERILPAHARS
jgi:hypothetical protein